MQKCNSFAHQHSLIDIAIFKQLPQFLLKQLFVGQLGFVF